MTRVAYLTPLYFDEQPDLGGRARFPLNLAKAVVKADGPQVDIVTYGEVPSLHTVSIGGGISLTVLPAIQRGDRGEPLSWDVTSAIRPADLVHIHQMFTRSSQVALLVAKLMGKPVCGTEYGTASSILGRPPEVLELVDRITCSSDLAATSFQTTTPVDVVRGGVDDDFFTPPVEPVSREGVVYAGRLLPHHGIELLIAALPPGVGLSICGPSNHAEYHERLRALAAGKDVEFVANTSDEQMRERYRRSVAVVLPPAVDVDSVGSGQPWCGGIHLSLLEAMACGCPAICSRVGAMPEYVDHGVTGFVFDELGELTGCLTRLAAEPELVQRLAGNAERTIRDRYGLLGTGMAMRSVYEQILTQSRST